MKTQHTKTYRMQQSSAKRESMAVRAYIKKKKDLKSAT